MGTKTSKFFDIDRSDSDVNYELISESGSVETEDSEVESSTILQFSSPLYFVEEHEGEVIIDIMRLGCQHGSASVYFHTEDMSGKSGERFEATEGYVTFEDGDHQKSISVPMIMSALWAPTLEFKVLLTQPKGAILGAYLHTCRVKVIDGEMFPSSRYPEVCDGREAIQSIGHCVLFSQYCKLNFNVPGIGRRTLVGILFDQMTNAYMYYKLWAISYLLNHVINDPEDSSFTFDERVEVAFFIGAGYIFPMFLIHAWELVKVRVDIGGNSRVYLQKAIITKYLNYNAESRAEVEIADIEIAVREDAAAIAEAYLAATTLLRILVKLVVVSHFVAIENPAAMHYVLIMFVLMLVFGCLRSAKLSKANELPLTLSARLLAYVAEIGKNYRLIANYFQRPHMNDTFDQKASTLRHAMMSPETVRINNDYFTKWLGPVFIGIYVMTHTRSVLSGMIGSGTFVATLNVFNEISTDFSEGYRHAMLITSIAAILNNMIWMLNLPTELLACKAVNRARRVHTTSARQKILDTGNTHHPFPTDLIPFHFKDVGYRFSSSALLPYDTKKFLQGINLKVMQGSMVAIAGEHGMGRQTFLRLIAHEVFPTEGELFIPTHLRILHVSQEVYILDASALLNLTFGHSGVAIDHVKYVLRRLGAAKLLDEVLDSEHRHVPWQGPEYLHGETAPQATTRSKASSSSTNDDEEYETTEDGTMFRLCCADEQVTPEPPDSAWIRTLNYSERAKLHLARAFIMNPEVMVLQRPLSHFNQQDQDNVLSLLKEHVRNRGLGLPPEHVQIRRPRSVFLSIDNKDHATHADVIWAMTETSDGGHSVIVVKDGGPKDASGAGMSHQSSIAPPLRNEFRFGPVH